MAKIITVAGGKGGTGKSMVASALAVLSAQEEKTVLIDADVECPNAHLLLNIALEEVRPLLQTIPLFDDAVCRKCGRCSRVCKQEAILVSNKKLAFIPELCVGCKACFVACPHGAISEGKKEIGVIHRGSNHGVHLISGELKPGELASGEIVTGVRKYAEEVAREENPRMTIIDAAAGIGCPVIASLVGSDYLLAVTEPTPSALHDLKRLMHLARSFQIPCSILINKWDLEEEFCKEIERFAQNEGVSVIGRIPYNKAFIDASLKKEPACEVLSQLSPILKKILNQDF